MENIAAPSNHAPGIKGIRLNWDWVTRPLFGLGLAVITIAAVFAGDLYMAFFVAVVGMTAAREWHRMITTQQFGQDFFITSATIVATLIAVLWWPNSILPWIVLAAGSAIALGTALSRGEPV